MVLPPRPRWRDRLPPLPRYPGLHFRVTEARKVRCLGVPNEQNCGEGPVFWQWTRGRAKTCKKVVEMLGCKPIPDALCVVSGDVFERVRLARGSESPTSIACGIDGPATVYSVTAALRAFISLEYRRSGRPDDAQPSASARCGHAGYRLEDIRSQEAVGEIAGPVVAVGNKQGSIQRHAQRFQLREEIFRAALKIILMHVHWLICPECCIRGCGLFQRQGKQPVVTFGWRKSVHAEAYLGAPS